MTPMAVAAERDLFDYLNTFGTVLAAFLAAFAVWQASRSSRKALEGIQRERRIDFELERLIDIQEALSKADHHTYGRNATIVMSLRLLPDQDLPLLREYFISAPGGKGPLISALGVQQEGGLTVEESRTATDKRLLREHMIDAVNATIRQRMNERGD